MAACRESALCMSKFWTTKFKDQTTIFQELSIRPDFNKSWHRYLKMTCGLELSHRHVIWMRCGMNTFLAPFSMISDVEALRTALLTKVPVPAAVPLDELRAEILKDFSSATVEIGMRQLVMQRVVAVQAGAVSLSGSSATMQSGSPRLLQRCLVYLVHCL